MKNVLLVAAVRAGAVIFGFCLMTGYKVYQAQKQEQQLQLMVKESAKRYEQLADEYKAIADTLPKEVKNGQ